VSKTKYINSFNDHKMFYAYLNIYVRRKTIRRTEAAVLFSEHSQICGKYTLFAEANAFKKGKTNSFLLIFSLFGFYMTVIVLDNIKLSDSSLKNEMSSKLKIHKFFTHIFNYFSSAVGIRLTFWKLWDPDVPDFPPTLPPTCRSAQG
jgi:hypothetical protein